MSEALLELDQLNKFYNPGSKAQVHAVKDVNLAVQKGEIVALLGSSGCGKTSTLRIIAGFEGASSGAVRIKSRDVHLLPPAKRNVAMAFEGYSLYPPLTVKDNIGFALRSQGMPAAEVETKVLEIARLLEIEDVLERFPSSLSGGQQQRASLGRALIRNADLHLLDEPMGQLEPQLRAVLRGRIKHFVKERGLTAILVTHDQTEANALADRIAVMEDGVLLQFDTPEALKDRPADLFTGAFIGEPPMNLFEARTHAHSGEVHFDLAGEVSLSYPESAFAENMRAMLISQEAVSIGIRPHAVRIGGDVATARVFANQWLGDQTHIAAHFAGGTIVSVVHDRADYAIDQAIPISIAADDLHIFDTSTGKALSHGGSLA